jgi:hypothetical protein
MSELDNVAMTQNEVQFWRKAAADLGIDVITPFETILTDGSHVKVSALVGDFGVRHGMVVDANYALIEPYAKSLAADGYGYSSNLGHSPESYDRNGMIEVLKDWGWSGDANKKPAWLV